MQKNILKRFMVRIYFEIRSIYELSEVFGLPIDKITIYKSMVYE